MVPKTPKILENMQTWYSKPFRDILSIFSKKGKSDHLHYLWFLASKASSPLGKTERFHQEVCSNNINWPLPLVRKSDTGICSSRGHTGIMLYTFVVPQDSSQPWSMGSVHRREGLLSETQFLGQTSQRFSEMIFLLSFCFSRGRWAQDSRNLDFR